MKDCLIIVVIAAITSSPILTVAFIIIAILLDATKRHIKVRWEREKV